MPSDNPRTPEGNEVVVAFYDLVRPGVWRYVGMFRRHDIKSWGARGDIVTMFPIPKFQVEINWREAQ